MSIFQQIQPNVSLRAFSTFGIDAASRFYLRVTDVTQLKQISQPELTGLPILILGGGSNLVLTRDFPGLVLHMGLIGRELIDEDEHYVYVRAAAGEIWHDFVQWTLAQGWGGLENLSLIPGSVGAAPIQNIGAYGVELKDYVHSLSWYEFATGVIHTMTRADCQFAYRDSVFKQALCDQGVIVDVTFALPKQWQAKLNYGDLAQVVERITAGQTPTPQQVSAAVCAIRQNKLPDPTLIGNVGSFFKNPLVSAETHTELLQRFPLLVSYPQADSSYKLAAGWLIEQRGWKGRVLGQAGVYPKQALVLVNLGNATGEEVLALAEQIQQDVLQHFGVQLDIEPRLV